MSEQQRIEPAEIAARLGWARPPEILDAMATAIHRGHHLALLAAEGSGREAVYALAALARREPGDEGLQALVLTATDERADRLGRALQRVCAPEALPVFVPERGWSDAEGVPSRSRILVGRPSRLLPAVRSGRVGLGSLRLLVLDGVAAMVSLEEWTSAEPLLEGLDPETVRIAASESPSPPFLELVERRLPRARRWPEELFPSTTGEEPWPPPGDLPLRIGLAGGERALELVTRCASEALREGDGTVRIACADAEDVPRLVAELGVRGHAATVQDGWIRVGDEDSDPEEEEAASILFGLPSGLPELERALGSAARRIAVVEPLHLAQLRLLAARARLVPELLPESAAPDELDAVALYRQRLREAIRSADVVPELLVIEPLLREFGAVRVAAALSERLRLRQERPGTLLSWPDVEAASLPASRPASPRRREKPTGEVPRPDRAARGPPGRRCSSGSVAATRSGPRTSSAP